MNKANYDGNTALIWVAKRNHPEVVRALLVIQDIKLYPEDIEFGETALGWASWAGHLYVIRAFLSQTGRFGRVEPHEAKAALIAVVEGDDPDFILTLLTASRFNHGDYIDALLAAVRKNRPKAGDTLLSSGVGTWILETCRTARDIAKRNNFTEVESLVEKYLIDVEAAIQRSKTESEESSEFNILTHSFSDGEVSARNHIEEAQKLPCGHQFHVGKPRVSDDPGACIEGWRTSGRSMASRCPICRGAF